MATEFDVMTDTTGKDIADAINANTVVLEEVRAAIEGKSKTLKTMSWTEIKAVIKEGKAREYFDIGDTKTFELTTGEKVEVRIIGFNHDADVSVTFEMTHCLATTYKMEQTNTNANGWQGCEFRETLNSTIYDMLPTELKENILEVEKKSTAGNQSSTIVTTKDKLFLFAPAEIWSESGIKNSEWSTLADNGETFCQEGTQYEYYQNAIANLDPNYDEIWFTTKHRTNSVYYCGWWLRSPWLASSASFCYVDYCGHLSYYSASSSYGVSFGFCL